MPTITDWIMVGITFLYMLFTIGIFIANLRSSESAKSQLEETKKQLEVSKTQFEEQLAETKRQYEETQRLSVMPYFQCDKSSSSYDFQERLAIITNNSSGAHHEDRVSFKNIGLGTAKDIKYIWKNKTSSYNRGAFLFQSALSGESQTVYFDFNVPHIPEDEFSVYIELNFKDLINNNYSQRIEFKFVKNLIYNNYSIHHISHEVEQIKNEGTDNA